MVVKKEFAILYKREQKPDNTELFIPFKVIEGTYNETDNWFIDENDIAYTHIAEPATSGICYANRVIFEEDESVYNEEFTKKVITGLIDLANKVILTRNINNDYYINLKVKETGEDCIFMDNDTAKIYEQYQEAIDRNQEEIYNREINMTPKEIVSEITKTIKGQDEAIKKIVTSIWTMVNFENMNKKNILIIGPSTVGKTATFKKLEQILDIPFSYYSVSNLLQTGYVDRNADEILLQLYTENEGNISKIENSIVILDDIDALNNNNYIDKETIATSVEKELIKIIEGTKRTFCLNNGANVTIDTSNIIFIGIGKFHELYEKPIDKVISGFGETTEETIRSHIITSKDLLKCGVKKEIVDRFPLIITFNQINEDILKDIILNSDESEFITYVRAIKSLGITISGPSELIDLISTKAMEKGPGTSSIITIITNIFENIFFEIGNDPGKYKEIILGQNILEDNTDYYLVPRLIKRRIKKFRKK